jgi:hypothetical protein
MKQQNMTEEREQNCMIREVNTGKLRSMFIRIDLGKIDTDRINTIDVDATVALVKDGKIIGVHFDWLVSGQTP